MNILYATNDAKVERLSSIDQHKNKLAVYSQGGWLPISYDVIDGIGCNGIKSHKAILSLDEDDLGYNFPEKYCYRPKDTYLVSDHVEDEALELPEYYGDGAYETHTDEKAITNADNGALGEHYKGRERVGLDVYRTKQILKASA